MAPIGSISFHASWDGPTFVMLSQATLQRV
jgi:hypothetical protein